MLRFEVFVTLCSVMSCALGGDEGSAQVIQYDFQRNGDAQYSYNYETSNGIKRYETGEEIPSIHDANNNAALVKGSFSYTGADGIVYTVNYVADEAGFHPEGEHLIIPPFTPWIPGQPIDDGQYQADDSGTYKPDNAGKYTPENGEGEQSPVLSPRPILEPKQNEPIYTSGERILNAYRTAPQPSTTPQPLTSVTQKYLPTSEPQKTNYIGGENILDTFLTTKALPPSTPQYLPASSTPATYTSGENILDTFRESSKVTPKYLPSFPTERPEANFFPTENSISSDIIQKAYFNHPTPHPEILLHSTPKGLPLSSNFGAASQNKLTYVKFQSQKDAQGARVTRSYHQYSR